ncbi:MAG: hypothetical protein L6R40_008622 [Gallowayella cf. fulva]|nr:MAG: hypothetical protein L6R40_008622 [Xanthomendoza cf. fulva]
MPSALEKVGSNDYEYAKPIAYPPLFHEFTSIPNITDAMRITTFSDLTTELVEDGREGSFQILDLFVAEIDKLKDAKGIILALVMQPIIGPMIHHH